MSPVREVLRWRHLQNTPCSGRGSQCSLQSWSVLTRALFVCERLGQSDLPAVQRVLFEMPIFDFSASNKHNDIYSTHTLWELGIWQKQNKHNTQMRCSSFQGWFHGGRGGARTPTSIPTGVTCPGVGGQRELYCCKDDRTSGISLNWLCERWNKRLIMQEYKNHEVKKEMIFITSKRPVVLSLALFYSLPRLEHFQDKRYVTSGGWEAIPPQGVAGGVGLWKRLPRFK